MSSHAWPRHSLEENNALLATIRRALITSVDDTGDQQLVNLQGLPSDQPTKIVRLLPHGFSSNPPQNSEGVLKSLSGRGSRGMFIGGENPKVRQRNLATGNAVLYDDKGNVVFMQSANGIAISTKQGALTITVAGAMPVTVNGGDYTLTVAAGNIALDPKGNNVFLGGSPGKGAFALVQTTAGPSINTYARIG